MKLLYSPGACSLGIHVVLEEIGQPYEAEAVNLRQPRPERPLTAINPKSKVPTLIRDDGSVLTEYPAIAYWLARSSPSAGLLPEGLDAETRTLETTEYCVSTVHMQGFSRLFVAGMAATPEEAEPIRKLGTEVATAGLARMSAILGTQDWATGSYSIADTAMYYVSRWAPRFGLELPANIAAHKARMEARPAVQRVLAAEGLT